MQGHLGNIQGRGTCRGSRVPVGTWDVCGFRSTDFFVFGHCSVQEALGVDRITMNALPYRLTSITFTIEKSCDSSHSSLLLVKPTWVHILSFGNGIQVGETRGEDL